MLLNEQFIDGEGTTFHVKKTYDVEPVIEAATALRTSGRTRLGHMHHVGKVPSFIITEWCKEAGISFSDTQAVKELLMKKLMSNEFAKFRVSEGNY